MKIERGRTYRAKRPAPAGSLFDPLVNDRIVLSINYDTGKLQYDSPSVGIGRKYPSTTIEAFERWAGRDITDEEPTKAWHKWNNEDRSKNK